MKKYKPYDLSDYIQIDAFLECSNCKKAEGYYTDDEEYFFHLGWRATRVNVYCPICAKKKLKNV